MFIGRENELRTLDKLYNSDKFEFAVIYGRRRVGKTALISEFAKNKDTVFFTGVETNAKQNLDNFSRCIMEYNTGIAADSSFSSFQSA
ncbi:MAG: ATP-binding protein, partial [Oscillospiraceae bacterium]